MKNFIENCMLIKKIVVEIKFLDIPSFFLSLIKIFYLKYFKNQYIYWIKLYKPLKMKRTNKYVSYFGELITFSQFHENEKYLNFFKEKKYKYLLDIGGHAGRISFFFNSIYTNRKSIYFEPNPNSFNLFNNFLIKNQIKNIQTLNIGVSNKKAILNFTLSSEYGGCSSFENIGEGFKKIKVPVNSIDNLIKCKEIKNSQNIDLIKIDVEGHEVNVIEGMKNFLKNKDLDLLIELNDEKAKINFLKKMKELKFKYNFKKVSSVDYLFKIQK